MSKAEAQAISELRRNENIVDKGNASDSMNCNEYNKKAQEKIEPHPFDQVQRDPTGKLEKIVNKCLWTLHQIGHTLRPLYNRASRVMLFASSVLRKGEGL